MSRFIQGAIKHPGSLTKYAQSHRLTTSKGTIDTERTKSYIERNEKGAEKTRRLRQVNLARTLKRLRA